MAPATLLLGALLALGTAVGFAAVGRLALVRAQGSSGVGTFFALFWFSAATVWTAQGAQSLLAYLGLLTPPLLTATDQVSSPFYCLAAGSLLYYVLYLVTGRGGIIGYIFVYYALLLFALRWSVAEAAPTGFEVLEWNVATTYERPLQGPFYSAVVSLIALPLLASILAYASLAFRVRDPAARYRIACVAGGLLLWVGTEALSFTSGIAATTAGELTRRLVALAATLLVLAGYLPPRVARERWGARDAWERA